MKRIFRLIEPAPLSVDVRSSECFTYLHRVMKFAGWLPPQQGIKRYAYLFCTFLAIVVSVIYLPIGSALSLIVDFQYLTPGEFLSVLQLGLNILATLMKTPLALSSIPRIRKAQLAIDKLDGSLQNNSDRRKIHKAVALGNFAFLAFAMLYFIYMVMMILTGVLSGKPAFLIYNPFFNWRESRSLFWIHAILEHIIVTIVVVFALILDSYTVVFMIIFRAHVSVLKDHVHGLRTNPQKTEIENYEELVSCIKDHKSILNCCNLMRPIITRTIFIQFQLIGVLLGLTMINIMYFADIFSRISSALYLTGLLLETFPFCYLCDLLVEDCIELSNLLGHSHWIDAKPRYKTALRIFMHHVQQPIMFIAGGIFPISLNSNIKVAKFAFSVMTVVRQLNLADRFNAVQKNI